MRCYALLLLCSPLVTGLVLRASQNPDEAKVTLDVAEDDPVDKMERELDDQMLSEFEPSAELSENWRKAIATKTKGHEFAKVLSSTQVVEACTFDIKKKAAAHPECADPWFQQKDCGQKYEIPSYRLGDLFFGYAGLAKNEKWTKFYFPESIGAKYLDQRGPKGDILALQKVVDSSDFDFVPKPEANEVVLHLRGFDALIAPDYGGYTKTPAWYKNVATQAAKTGFTQLTIVTGDHRMGQNADSSKPKKAAQAHNEEMQAMDQTLAKIEEIRAVFEKEKFAVKTRVNHNADCDFVFMANAHFFIPSGGTFDTLIKEIVTRKGHKVLMGTDKAGEEKTFTIMKTKE